MILGFVRKCLLRILYGSRARNDIYIRYLKKLGIVVGKGTIFYEPYTNNIDVQNPLLLSFGENVRVTAGVKILTHDYSWSVITGVYGECVGGVAPTKIGSNVFIGMNAIITAGVIVGDNVVIGAGAIVTKDCEPNSVYAGVPAKKIMSLEEFYCRRKNESHKNISKILDIVGDSAKAKEKYLREYAFYDFSIIADREKLMNDTGYYEKAKMFYEKYGR